MNEKLQEIRKYWKGTMIPQQWYSDKIPLSNQWFNEITLKGTIYIILIYINGLNLKIIKEKKF